MWGSSNRRLRGTKRSLAHRALSKQLLTWPKSSAACLWPSLNPASLSSLMPAWVRGTFFAWDTHKAKIILGKCGFRTRIHTEEMYGASCRMQVVSTASARSSGSDKAEKCLIFRAHSHKCMHLFLHAHTHACTHTYDTDYIWLYLLPCLSKCKFFSQSAIKYGLLGISDIFSLVSLSCLSFWNWTNSVCQDFTFALGVCLAETLASGFCVYLLYILYHYWILPCGSQLHEASFCWLMKLCQEQRYNKCTFIVLELTQDFPCCGWSG